MILPASFAEVLANQRVTVSAMRVSLPKANPLHNHSLPEIERESDSVKLVEEGLGVLEVMRVEAFGEPFVDRG